MPLSSLEPAQGNPRRHTDRSHIAGLAESIRTDGVLGNLVVESDGNGVYRIVAGTRRLQALTLLRDRGENDEAYKVHVETRKNLDGERTLRIATVENVQREPFDLLDEADTVASDTNSPRLAWPIASSSAARSASETK